MFKEKLKLYSLWNCLIYLIQWWQSFLFEFFFSIPYFKTLFSIKFCYFLGKHQSRFASIKFSIPSNTKFAKALHVDKNFRNFFLQFFYNRDPLTLWSGERPNVRWGILSRWLRLLIDRLIVKVKLEWQLN